MNQSILSGILIFGILQSLFFALLFLSKRGKSLHDIIIGIWLVVLALQISFITTDLLIVIEHPIFRVFQISFILLHGPFLYLYSRKLINVKPKLNLYDFFHFLPFLVHVVTGIIVANYTLQILINEMAVFGMFSGVFYSVVTILILNRHQITIQQEFSFTEKINLNWIFRLATGFLLLWVVGSVSATMVRFMNVDLSLSWLFIFVPFFIFYIGFHGIKQDIIYSHLRKQSNKTTDNTFSSIISQSENEKITLDKYRKSGLQEKVMATIYHQLKNSMVEDKLYLKPELSLSEISEHLMIPTHHITQTLNMHAKKSFYDFVNSYRVEEFKKQVILHKNSHFSILGIAFDCGFNSKSSFNRIFKEITGMTPSEFKKTGSIKM